jgi:tol-pal system protein YbgF
MDGLARLAAQASGATGPFMINDPGGRDMRQTGMIRYGVLAALLLFLEACANMPGMRTSMPPVPAETAPGSEAPSQPQAAPDDLAQQVRNLETRVRQLETQVATLESHRAAPTAPKPHVVPAPATAMYPQATANPVVSNGAAEKHYTEGMRLYHAKKYGEARQQFYDYLKNLPKGPRAPESRYYLADSFYKEGKYREAAVEFNKLRLQFPRSILAPAGLLRQALCYKGQQQMLAYRDTLRKLVKAYPGSPEAKEAKKMLREGSQTASR